MTGQTVEQVQVVSSKGVTLGTSSKLGVHVAPGQLHRAVSVMVFDEAGRALLQRRAPSVYHFAKRWSNTCCTHPRADETPLDAAERRLGEEMGIAPLLREVGTFRYRAEDVVSGSRTNTITYSSVHSQKARNLTNVSSPTGPGLIWQHSDGS